MEKDDIKELFFKGKGRICHKLGELRRGEDMKSVAVGEEDAEDRGEGGGGGGGGRVTVGTPERKS